MDEENKLFVSISRRVLVLTQSLAVAVMVGPVSMVFCVSRELRWSCCCLCQRSLTFAPFRPGKKYNRSPSFSGRSPTLSHTRLKAAASGGSHLPSLKSALCPCFKSALCPRASTAETAARASARALETEAHFSPCVLAECCYSLCS